jgi:hypothetical protein
MIDDTIEFHDLIKKEVDKSLKIVDGLVKVSPIDVNETNISRIPKDRGIYFWSCKDTGEVDYVGVALGKRGLKQRIASQHLRSSYIKSVFRIKISDEHKIDLGAESANFIRERYNLSYLPCPNAEKISLRIAELLLIATFRPKYNDVSPVG